MFEKKENTKNGESEEFEMVQELSLDSLRAAFAEYEHEESSGVFFVNVEDEEVYAENAENSLDEEPLNDSQPGDLDEDYDEEYEEYSEYSEQEELVDDSPERIETSPLTILEAMLFVGDRENKPLLPDRAAELMRNVTQDEIIDAVAELNRKYESNGCPYIIEQEEDGFRLVLHSDFDAMRSGFYGKTREARLSQQAVDILAIVAYKQPISAEDIQQIRKAPVGGILGQLQRRELLQVEKVTDGKKRVSLYSTTERFLQLFGLESLDDLPIADDLDFK